MPAVVVDGVPPWDGSYAFDDFSFTNRELFKVKQISGIRAGELIEALEANDTSAYVGVAMVVMERHGVNLDVDDLWNAPVGSIVLDLADGVVADPPTMPAAESEPSVTDGSSGSGSDKDGG